MKLQINIEFIKHWLGIGNKTIKKQMQKIMYTYRHISQGFAANWTGVVTASVCLTEIDKVGNQISTTDRKDIYQ